MPGEGPEDPRAPRQLYDERGRPINPETKRINRDVIRSHNEVMMVIGVAEPENSLFDAQAEAAREQQRYEDRVGRKLLLYSSVLNTAAIWGINGMRQRILVSHLPITPSRSPMLADFSSSTNHTRTRHSTECFGWPGAHSLSARTCLAACPPIWRTCFWASYQLLDLSGRLLGELLPSFLRSQTSC